MKKDSYTLGDLVKVTGAKRRSIQLWAHDGVLHAERGTEKAGTGTHRRFSRREAIVACVIHPFADRQIAIGELLTISQVIRGSLVVQPESFEAAIAGDGETIFAYEVHKNTQAGTEDAQFSIMQRKDLAERTVSWPDMVMAIRLETYLVGLR